jgi:thermitase
VQNADLTWSNLTGSSVDVYRGSAKIATVGNSGRMTDPIGQKGAGSYIYRVCAAGTSTCTNQASASF